MDIHSSNSQPIGKSINPKEDEVQQDVWKWLAYIPVGPLSLQSFTYMVPNGTYLGSGSRAGKARYIAKLKSMGFKSGVSDLVIALPRAHYSSAYIELKRKKGGTLRPGQKDFLRLMWAAGHYVTISRGFDEACEDIQDYMNGKPPRSLVQKRLDIRVKP